MPLALRMALVSWRALKSCARSTWCATDQRLLIIATSTILCGSTASGAPSWMSMVSGSTMRTRLMLLSTNWRCEGGASARSNENTASSAVNVLPSWKCTSGRSLKRQVRGSGCDHGVASTGTRW